MSLQWLKICFYFSYPTEELGDFYQVINCNEAFVRNDEEIVARQETLLSILHQLHEDVSEFERTLKEVEINHKALEHYRKNPLIVSPV